MIQSTMFLDETSFSRPMPKIFAGNPALLKPGGIVLHVEQPVTMSHMTLFRTGDARLGIAFYNNEPFWTKNARVDL